jgi:WD40 repeat protein
LAAASASVLDTDAQLGILLALEAVEATPVPEREAVEALHQSLHANRLLAAAGWPEDRVAATQMAVAASPDGDRFAVSADGAVIDVWDVASKTLVATMGETVGEADLIAWPMIDWHGNRLAGLGPDGVLRVWDSDSGEGVGHVEADSKGPGTTEYSPDGSLIATVHQAGSPVEANPTALRVWDAETLEMVWEQPYDGVISVAFDPRGAFTAVARFAIDATSGLVEVREVATGELIYSFETDSWATAVTVSPNSDLVVGHWNGLATVHDGATGDQIGELGPAADPNGVVAHSPVGSLVALNDEIWDVESGSLVRLLEVDAARIRFTDDGSRILTGGLDLVGRVWALTDPGPGELFTFSPAPVVQAVDLSADGSLLAVLALPERYPSVGTVEVRSWESQELFATIPDRTGQDVALSPDGSIVAAFGEDGLGLWRADGDALVPNLEESIELIGREGGSGVSFSPDGTLVAATGSTGMAGVWEATTGRPVGKPWRVSQSQAFTVAFSPDGSLIVTTDNDGGVRVWRVSDLTEVTSFVLDGFTGDVFFSQGGRTVIVLWQEGVAILDLETGDRIDLAAGESIYGDLSPNEDLLAIGSDDGVDIWDLEARQLVSSLRGLAGDVTGVDFHRNGTHLVTGGGDSVRGWTLDTDELVAIARSRAARSLTDTECQTYLHIDACPAR